MQQFDLKDKSFLDYSKSKIVNNAINELSEEKKATVYNVVKLYENENNLLNLVKNLLQLDLTNDILNCTILIIFQYLIIDLSCNFLDAFTCKIK